MVLSKMQLDAGTGRVFLAVVSVLALQTLQVLAETDMSNVPGIPGAEVGELALRHVAPMAISVVLTAVSFYFHHMKAFNNMRPNYKWAVIVVPLLGIALALVEFVQDRGMASYFTLLLFLPLQALCAGLVHWLHKTNRLALSVAVSSTTDPDQRIRLGIINSTTFAELCDAVPFARVAEFADQLCTKMSDLVASSAQLTLNDTQLLVAKEAVKIFQSDVDKLIAEYNTAKTGTDGVKTEQLLEKLKKLSVLQKKHLGETGENASQNLFNIPASLFSESLESDVAAFMKLPTKDLFKGIGLMARAVETAPEKAGPERKTHCAKYKTLKEYIDTELKALVKTDTSQMPQDGLVKHLASLVKTCDALYEVQRHERTIEGDYGAIQDVDDDVFDTLSRQLRDAKESVAARVVEAVLAPRIKGEEYTVEKFVDNFPKNLLPKYAELVKGLPSGVTVKHIPTSNKTPSIKAFVDLHTALVEDVVKKLKALTVAAGELANIQDLRELVKWRTTAYDGDKESAPRDVIEALTQLREKRDPQYVTELAEKATALGSKEVTAEALKSFIGYLVLHVEKAKTEEGKKAYAPLLEGLAATYKKLKASLKALSEKEPSKTPNSNKATTEAIRTIMQVIKESNGSQKLPAANYLEASADANKVLFEADFEALTKTFEKFELADLVAKLTEAEKAFDKTKLKTLKDRSTASMAALELLRSDPVKNQTAQSPQTLKEATTKLRAALKASVDVLNTPPTAVTTLEELRALWDRFDAINPLTDASIKKNELEVNGANEDVYDGPAKAPLAPLFELERKGVVALFTAKKDALVNGVSKDMEPLLAVQRMVEILALAPPRFTTLKAIRDGDANARAVLDPIIEAFETCSKAFLKKTKSYIPEQNNPGNLEAIRTLLPKLTPFKIGDISAEPVTGNEGRPFANILERLEVAARPPQAQNQ